MEHIVTRVKTPESILRKAASRGLSMDLDALRSNVTDIAGARVIERFDLEYRSALLQVEARLEVLRDEFTHLHDYNPIEHIVTRVKTPESILRKAASRGLSMDLDALRS
ncbi:hypothetical protein D9C01_13195, partial [Corynebacterium diphtheriae]